MEQGVSNMNIDFLVDKENKRVVVSNEHGNMTFREYQDNIKDVLFLEDIVEGLENDFNKLNEEKEKADANVIDIEKRIGEAPIWQKRADKRWYGTSMGAFTFSAFLGYAVNVSDLKANVLEQLQNIEVLNSTRFGVNMGIIFASVILITRYRIRKEKREENQEDLENVEAEIKDLKLKLFFTKHILFDYKDRLMYELQKKQKSNLQNMPVGIQEISYSEPLENLRNYIKKLYEENKENKQETTKEDNQILGRFKKKI